MPTFAVFRLVLAEFHACCSRLLLEYAKRAALEHTASLFPQTRIEAHFAVVFLVPIPLHHADVLPSLPGAVEVTDADEVELLVLEAKANLFRLLYSELGQLAAAVPLDDSVEVRKSLPVPHQPEIDHLRLICCHSLNHF